MKELREYQEEAYQCLCEAIDAGKTEALLIMASGLGKTVIAAHLAQMWLRTYTGRILFLVHMTDVIDQAKEEFLPALNGRFIPGIWTGRSRDEIINANVVFATFQSMDTMEIDPGEFSLIIVDEAHHAQAPTYRKIIEGFDPKFLLGMTATPERMDGLDIVDIFGEPVYTYDLPVALANRDLSQVKYSVMTDNIDREELARLVKRVEEGDRTVSKSLIDHTVFLKERTEKIAEIVQEQRAGTKTTIVFCRSLEHIRHVSPFFPDSLPYHSKLNHKERKEILAWFKEGEITTLLVVDTFNEGIDIPEAELLVFLRSTCSKRVWLQQLGRGLRKTETKQHVTVLDFVANCDRVLAVQGFEQEIVEALRALGEGANEPTESFTLSASGLNIDFFEEAVSIIGLLERFSRDFYLTWEEASQAAQVLGLKTGTEYLEGGYKSDPRLPSNPIKIYPDVWEQNDKWPGFLGTLPYKT